MMRFAVAVVCQKAQSMWLHFILGFSILLPVHLVLNDAVSEQYIVMVNLILGVFIAVSLNHVLKGIFDQDFLRMHLMMARKKVVPFVAMVMAAFFLLQSLPLGCLVFAVSGANGYILLLLYLGLLHAVMYAQSIYYILLPECSSLWVSVLVFPLLLPMTMMFAYVISRPGEGVMLMALELLLALNLMLLSLGPYVIRWGLGLKRGY